MDIKKKKTPKKKVGKHDKDKKVKRTVPTEVLEEEVAIAATRNTSKQLLLKKGQHDVSNALEEIGLQPNRKVDWDGTVHLGLPDNIKAMTFYSRGNEGSAAEMMVDCLASKDLAENAEAIETQLVALFTMNKKVMPRVFEMAVRPEDAETVMQIMTQVTHKLNRLARRPTYQLEIKDGVPFGGGMFGSKKLRLRMELTNITGELSMGTMSFDELRERAKIKSSDDPDLNEVWSAVAMFNVYPDLATYQQLVKVIARFKDKFQNDIDRMNAVGVLAEQCDSLFRELDSIKPLNFVEHSGGEVVGVGQKGGVKKYTFRLQSGELFVGAVKWDSNKASDAAGAAGIDKRNPEESRRGVAAYECCKMMKLNCIPETHFIRQADNTGRARIGQAIEFIKGTEGQKSKRLKKKSDEGVQGLLELAQQMGEELVTQPHQEVIRNEFGQVTEVWERSLLMVPQDFNSAVIQEGMSTLQWVDCIIGAQDRHPGNIMYETDKFGKVVRVVGIDNDDAFAPNWTFRTGFGSSSKTPGFPPTIDVHTAVGILEMTPQKLAETMRHLKPGDRDKALERLVATQKAVLQTVKAGQVASFEGMADFRLVRRLRELAGVQELKPMAWGGPAMLKLHNMDNSYLGGIVEFGDATGWYAEDGDTGSPKGSPLMSSASSNSSMQPQPMQMNLPNLPQLPNLPPLPNQQAPPRQQPPPRQWIRARRKEDDDDPSSSEDNIPTVTHGGKAGTASSTSGPTTTSFLGKAKTEMEKTPSAKPSQLVFEKRKSIGDFEDHSDGGPDEIDFDQFMEREKESPRPGGKPLPELPKKPGEQ